MLSTSTSHAHRVIQQIVDESRIKPGFLFQHHMRERSTRSASARYHRFHRTRYTSVLSTCQEVNALRHCSKVGRKGEKHNIPLGRGMQWTSRFAAPPAHASSLIESAKRQPSVFLRHAAVSAPLHHDEKALTLPIGSLEVYVPRRNLSNRPSQSGIGDLPRGY